MSQISIAPPLGDITIKTTSAPKGVTIDSLTMATIKAAVKVALEGVLIELTAKDPILGTEGVVSISGQAITIGGKTEPALLGKKFLDIFKDHQHTSSVGPTGPIMPQFAMNALNSMSKKVFLG